MSVTPQMNLLLPEPTVTPGPEWALEVNTALEKIDLHDHSSGSGKKITPTGIDINVSLDMKLQALVNANKVNLVNQPIPLSGAGNVCSISFVNGNFYITNSGGVAVQVTNGTSVVNTTIIPSSPLMPSGTVLDYAGITVPAGFLSADGSAVSRATYPELFTAIGTSYGIGDGATTFLLPNCNGRATIGAGTYTDVGGTGTSVTRSLSQTMGASVHTLTESQIPSHNHSQNPHTHNIIVTRSEGGAISSDLGAGMGDNNRSATVASSTATNNPTGGGLSHNNMQPSIVINKIIKT